MYKDSITEAGHSQISLVPVTAQVIETPPEELKLAVHLREQARPRRWMLGCKPSASPHRGDFNRVCFN